MHNKVCTCISKKNNGNFTIIANAVNLACKSAEYESVYYRISSI